MGLRLQFLLGLGKDWLGVSVSDSTFMVLSFPPTPVSGHSSLSSPPVELGGNIRWVLKVSLVVQILSLSLICFGSQ